MPMHAPHGVNEGGAGLKEAGVHAGVNNVDMDVSWAPRLPGGIEQVKVAFAKVIGYKANTHDEDQSRINYQGERPSGRGREVIDQPSSDDDSDCSFEDISEPVEVPWMNFQSRAHFEAWRHSRICKAPRRQTATTRAKDTRSRRMSRAPGSFAGQEQGLGILSSYLLLPPAVGDGHIFYTCKRLWQRYEATRDLHRVKLADDEHCPPLLLSWYPSLRSNTVPVTQSNVLSFFASIVSWYLHLQPRARLQTASPSRPSMFTPSHLSRPSLSLSEWAPTRGTGEAGLFLILLSLRWIGQAIFEFAGMEEEEEEEEEEGRMEDMSEMAISWYALLEDLRWVLGELCRLRVLGAAQVVGNELETDVSQSPKTDVVQGRPPSAGLGERNVNIPVPAREVADKDATPRNGKGKGRENSSRNRMSVQFWPGDS